MKKLNMAKERFDKINITEVAIDKVPYIQFEGIDEKYYKIIQSLTKEVLRVSKEKNNCNEVAITYRMKDEKIPEYGVALGDQHSVGLESDTYSNHLLKSTTDTSLVVLHNHPSPQTLSYLDLLTFFSYSNIKMILVVTNQGKIHYVIKGERYDFNLAASLMKKYIKLISKTTKKSEIYKLTKEALKESAKVGVIYK